MNPRVSVVLTTYNQASYVCEAIEGALRQTFRSREILVVDDGSTDGTETVVAPYRDQITYIRQRNQGVAGSRNTGVLHARGELVAFLDGDDLWDPEKLGIQVAAAEREPRCGLIAVNGVEFSADGILRSSLFGEAIEAQFGPDRLVVTLDCYAQLLKCTNLISTISQVMIPKRVLDEVGLSDVRREVSSDWDLYLRIAARYKLTFVNKPLARWRYLDTSASGPAAVRWLRWTQDDLEILKDQLQEGPSDFAGLIREEVARRMARAVPVAYYYGRRHDRSWALKYLAVLFRNNPTQGRILAHLAALSMPQSLVRGLRQMARRVHRPSTASQMEDYSG
jgi:glycosyltransferase involved in cell wall biosynthesis